MGQYINPPDEVKRRGRRLESRSSYAELVEQLQPGENLYGLFDRGIFKNAPLLDSAAEFHEFYKQLMSGQFMSAEYYAVR